MTIVLKLLCNKYLVSSYYNAVGETYTTGVRASSYYVRTYNTHIKFLRLSSAFTVFFTLACTQDIELMMYFFSFFYKHIFLHFLFSKHLQKHRLHEHNNPFCLPTAAPYALQLVAVISDSTNRMMIGSAVTIATKYSVCVLCKRKIHYIQELRLSILLHFSQSQIKYTTRCVNASTSTYS